MTETSDSGIIERSWREPSAFATLFDRHFGSVYRFCARRTSRDVAEDLAGETFRRAFEHRRHHHQPNRL